MNSIKFWCMAGMLALAPVLVSCEKTSAPHSWIEPGDSSGSDDDTGNNGGESGGPSFNYTEVETLEADSKAYNAMLYGRISGSKIPSVVGFQVSYDADFPKSYTQDVSIEGVGGRFKIQVAKLVDLATVYYRAYAVIDGEYIYGATRNFETLQGTYKVDGVTYKFIKVTGLPTGSYSMMQTEMPSTSTIEFEGVKMIPDINANGEQTKGEFREFLSSFPFVMRGPAVVEWQFAAKGGNDSHGLLYSGSDTADDVAWTSSNSGGSAKRVALKAPNELGFYDMSGNYAEFCAAYNDDQLLDMADNVRKFAVTVRDVSAEMFNLTWAVGGGACGGMWSSAPSQCTVDSKVPFSLSSNKFDASRYCYRLVYSRPD